MPKHLRSLVDVNAAELERIVELGRDVKRRPQVYAGALEGRSVALIFAKPSTRTRVSFEVGCHQLGAQAVVLNTGGATGMQMGRGESVADTARVLSRYVDAIVIRTFAQEEVDELARWGTVPVVNALTDSFHPCQALADVLTLRERFGRTEGLKLVYVGAGNNVAHSLLLAGPRAGVDVVVCCPEGLDPDSNVLERARADARDRGTTVAVERDPEGAVAGAQVVYTDTWVSMGQDDRARELRERLARYAVTSELMARAAPEAVFMHCLPAHRGEEVAPEVIDGPQSIVFDQAENRLHVQKALLMLLLGASSWS